ncbi:unnamed protein product [Arctia plantaginis]|uniref:Glucose-methanol-choline oxidoreductase N-terminal domain-containing protein n=1 Tax=Arctia plantaginis TaxID=874455 RepID=A0A8S0YNQ0_ARCPL|nr:unnamed protein product [Arctia plantaginis]
MVQTINSVSVEKNYKNVQKMFQLAAALQLTSYLWPVPLPIQNGTHYDYIIVGGGTAGCVVASRLLEMSNVSVLLIEAGGNPPLESIYTKYFAHMKHTPVDWNLTASRERWTSNHPFSRPDIVQGRMLGGSSSLNHLIYGQGNPADYDGWASITDDPSWSFKAIHHYFIKSEKIADRKILTSIDDKNMHGTTGKMKLRKFYFENSEKYLRAFKEMGNKIVRSINAKHPLGFSPALFTCGKRVRQSTAYSFLRPEKYNPNLNVLTNTMVRKVIFDEFHNAIGVEVISKDKRVLHVEAHKEVIVTAGVFKTPQLLMLSGIGPRKHLKDKNIKLVADLPVGKNLQDHPICVSVFKTGLKKLPDDIPSPYKIDFPQLHGYVSLNDFETIPTYEIRGMILDDPATFLELCIMSLNFKYTLCDDLVKSAANHEIFLVLNHLSYPKSRGEVRLGIKNINEPPIVKLGFYRNEKDLELHAKSLMNFNRILNTSYFWNNKAQILEPPIGCGKINFSSLKYWQCYCNEMATTLHNNVGTCAMGTVVDSNLLVKGVHRLRIADASIMPTIVSSPTQASVIMIAQKASDMIKEDFVRHSK